MKQRQDSQFAICKRFNASFLEPDPNMMIGISQHFDVLKFPIHGLRHPPENGTTGWYLWTGKYTEDADFFIPRHLYHFYETHPDVSNYLGLAPGWRFLIAPDYEDIWEDLSLLNI